jgi:lysozyme
MNFSKNCLDLIKTWEGLFLDAYIDPVGVPTIGYGTIRYPNGQIVKLGDKITKQQAEAFLQDECNEFSESLASLINVPIDQNQFDALVSFCYNLGVGAFEGSTLRKELNAGNISNAANEFDRWVFGMIGGVKTQLPGLVNRRKDEKALFLKASGQGNPIEIEKSIQDTVTWIEAYRDNADNVLVAWNNNRVVEILTLKSRDKNDLLTILQQYKNANDFIIAPSGKAIPTGDRIQVSDSQKKLKKVANPPALNRPLLIKGMNDNDQTGDDIKELQKRLKDLGYYQGEIDGDFGRRTDDAVKSFQAEYFGSAEADGKVGSITWAKLWGEQINTPTPIISTSTKPYLRLTKTNQKDKYGCYVLILEYIKNNRVADSLEVCSGQPNHQAFRIGSNSNAGSYEPLPEGRWSISDIIFAGGVNDYETVYEDGVGPVKIPLDYAEPGDTERGEILFHTDWNRGRGFPGTVGCVGTYSLADTKTLVGWLRDTNPQNLYVDWKLGTCPQPI